MKATTTNHHHNYHNHHNRQHHRRKPPKLPHILSDSSPSDTPRSNSSNLFPTAYSTYSNTPSQTSSLWNWENFYPPPPPPGSDYFNETSSNSKKQYSQADPEEELEHEEEEGDGYSRPRSERNFNTNYHQQEPHHHHGHHLDDDDDGVGGGDDERSEYDFFNHGKQGSFEKQRSFQKQGSSFRKQGMSFQKHHLTEDYAETEREEVQCSDWGDHLSSATSSDDDDGGGGGRGHGGGGVVEEEDSRSEIGTRSNFGSSVRGSSLRGEPAAAAATPRKAAAPADDGAASGAGSNYGEMMMVVRHRDLKEIVEAIKESFEKAAVAGDQVSEMLEISKAQLDRSFKQLRSIFPFFIFFFLKICLTPCNWSSSEVAVYFYCDQSLLVFVR